MAKKIIYSQIRNQFRHDTIKKWETKNPILLEGEIGVVIGLNEIGDNLEAKTQKAKIGDGIHPWNELEWWSFIQGNGPDNDILVDQTYNPESENAQSGKAVAEALEDITLQSKVYVGTEPPTDDKVEVWIDPTGDLPIFPSGSGGGTGKDGFSPTVSVTETTSGHTVSITDINGTKSFDVLNGQNGEQGLQGDKGDKGDKGVDGYTPVKGVDYFTNADKNELVNSVIEQTGIDIIPDYVITEAESVIDRVIDAQGKRTFTFAAISDLHYGNGGYTDGILHATQALKYIDSRIKLDAVAILGDYTDGYPASDLTNAFNDFKTINSVLNDLRFAPNLRQQGNHDYYADNLAITNRFIQAYSDNVIWGDKVGGYYYKDFEEYKLRIISLNTVEQNNENIDCSDAQYKWFVESLDLSTKENHSDWQILILSHHPLDWYSNDANEENNYWYRLPKILYGYKNGLNSATANGYGESFKPTFDFSKENNKATVICNIHGHIHNFLTAPMYLNIGATSAGNVSIYRMATPEACINRANQYDGVWKEATTYNKTINTAEDTSFVIYCIDLDTNIINAVCYGAGYDRTLNYITSATYYSIVNTLTGVTTNNTETLIEENKQYVATLTAKNGALTSIVVKMGGMDITSSVYSNGVITIPVVTGNIEIIASAPTYINQLPLAVASDNTLYNGGKGWKADTRLNSSGDETAYTDVEVTGFIPVKKGDVIYFKNISLRANGGGTYANQEYLAFYDSNKTKLSSATVTYLTSLFASNGGPGENCKREAETFNLLALDTAELAAWSDSSNNKWGSTLADAAYFRFSAGEITDNSIVSINEPIE